jgi:hypothetical protein
MQKVISTNSSLFLTVVRHLLSAWRHPTNNGPAGELQVRPHQVSFTRDQEQLLLKADVAEDFVRLVAQQAQKAGSLLREGFCGPQERSLFVKSLALVGHEASRNKDGVSAQEDGRGGINDKISSGLVRGAEASIRIGRPVRLAAEQIRALEPPDRATFIGKFDHLDLNLCGLSMANSSPGS